MKKLTFLHTAFCLTTMAVATSLATSCADDIDINNNNGGKGNALTLKLNTANYHQDADARITRVINAQAPNGQNIKVVETDYNFIEDNITPVAALTRGPCTIILRQCPKILSLVFMATLRLPVSMLLATMPTLSIMVWRAKTAR